VDMEVRVADQISRQSL